MAAPIVNDGVGNGGTLFLGKKFWIAQRVPTRSRWVDLVKANGGEIVSLEKLADIMIADHARKDAPPGTTSWRFIEDSVKKGELEDLEKYPAGPKTDFIRPVGAAQASRKGRVPFTSADDLILAKWVSQKEVEGMSARGNTIYQDLEKLHPHHTFQSWRDRWIKYIQHRSLSEIVDDSSSAQVPEPLVASTTSPRNLAVEPHEPSKEDLPLPGATAGPAPVASDELSIAITSSPSASNPPRRVEESENLCQKTTTDDTPSFASGSATPSRSHDSLGIPSGILGSSKPKRQKPIKGLPFTTEDHNLLASIYDDIMNIQENKTIIAWQTWASLHPQHTAQEWYSYWIEKVKPSKRPTTSDSTSSETSKRLEQSQTTAPEATMLGKYEAQFRRKVAEFSAQHEITIDFCPKVAERRISLFTLFQVMRRPEVGGFDKIDATGRWPEIASFLGLNTFRDPSIPSELKQVYEYMLADFSDFIQEYWDILNDYINRGWQLTDDEKTDYEVFALQSSNLFETIPEPGHENILVDITRAPASESTLRNVHSNLNSNEGNLDTGTKRLLQDTETTLSKRQKFNKGKGKILEIPSTPEDRLTPNTQALQLPPPKFNITKSIKEDEQLAKRENEKGSVLDGLSKPTTSSSNALHSSSKEILDEPETQDFHFFHPNKDNRTSSSSPVKESAIEDGVATLAGPIHEESSTQLQSDSQRAIAELQETIDHYVALRYPEDIVRQALVATTMETGDLGMVVESITSGNGIPENIQGVWTEKDDIAVMLAEDTKEYTMTVAKHGEARCDVRKQFLMDAELIRSV